MPETETPTDPREAVVARLVEAWEEIAQVEAEIERMRSLNDLRPLLETRFAASLRERLIRAEVALRFAANDAKALPAKDLGPHGGLPF